MSDILERVRPDAADPIIDRELIDHIRQGLRDDLADAATFRESVYVSKHHLSTVLGCELHHLEGGGEFEWTPATARGTIAHKAIELYLNGADRPNGELVDGAIGRLQTDSWNGVGRWLEQTDDFTAAEARSAAVATVAAFRELIGMIPAAWNPVTEQKVSFRLFGEQLNLTGKTDLTLGGGARKVIIDLKSGARPQPTHRDDLRFYAMLEALRTGNAPRRTASVYLDSGTADVEIIDENIMLAAGMRTSRAVRRILELKAGDTPVLRPGRHCTWCALRETCPSSTVTTNEEDIFA